MNILVSLLLVSAVKVSMPPPVLKDIKMIPLGIVRVTKYTWHEGGKWTADGHKFEAGDENKICAASRDLWKKKVKPGDTVWIKGQAQCVVRDSMANRNSKGFRQRRWLDIYIGSDQEAGLDFGIQKSEAYIIRGK